METISQEAKRPLTIHWQPIETAPKDGTEIIGVVEGFVPSQAHWDKNSGQWIDDGEDFPSEGNWELTHWIPMPEFP